MPAGSAAVKPGVSVAGNYTAELAFDENDKLRYIRSLPFPSRPGK